MEFPTVDTLSAGISSIYRDVSQLLITLQIYKKKRYRGPRKETAKKSDLSLKTASSYPVALSEYGCVYYFSFQGWNSHCVGFWACSSMTSSCVFMLCCFWSTLPCKFHKFKVSMSWNMLLLSIKQTTLPSVVSYSCRAMLEIWQIEVPPPTPVEKLTAADWSSVEYFFLHGIMYSTIQWLN